MYLRWPISYHGKDMTKVYGEGLQVWVREAVRLLLFQGLSVVVNMNDSILHLQLVVQVLRNALRGV